MNGYDFEQLQIDQRCTISFMPASSPHQSIQNSRAYFHHVSKQDRSNHDQDDQTLSIPFPNQRKNNQISQAELYEQRLVQAKVQMNKTYSQTKFNQFIEKQKAYERRVNEKIEKLKEQKQNMREKQTFKPQINQKSKNYTRNTSKSTVFDRLYAPDQSRKQETQTKQLFHPKISQKSKQLHRPEPVGQLLYKDAKSRQQKQYQSTPTVNNINHMSPRSPSMANQTISSPSSKYYSSTSSKSQQLLMNKFLKQYFEVLQAPQLLNIFEQHISAKIEKSVFQYILQKLGFIKNVGPSSSVDAEIAQQAYHQLSKNQANLVNLFTFLLAIIGVQKISLTGLEGLGDSKNFIKRSQQQARLLHSRFNSLYRNRLCTQHNKSTDQQFSFKPYLSPQSFQLAQKHRKQVLQQASKYISPTASRKQSMTITHPQFLLLNQQMRDIQLRQQRAESQQKLMKQCTFKPNVSNMKKSMNIQVKHRQKSTFTQQNISDYSRTSQHKDIVAPSLYTITHNDPSLMVVLEVNFGDADQQIVLRRQDGNKLHQIVKYYSSKYQFNQESQSDLLLMLNVEYHSVFNSI